MGSSADQTSRRAVGNCRARFCTRRTNRAGSFQFLPFEEASANKGVQAFLRYVGASKANGFAVYGWSAALAFVADHQPLRHAGKDRCLRKLGRSRSFSEVRGELDYADAARAR
jgi:hypothetical protein